MGSQDDMQPAEVSSTKLTYDDYLLFPDDGRRHELIDGEQYVTPAPSLRHQEISKRLFLVLSVVPMGLIGVVSLCGTSAGLPKISALEAWKNLAPGAALRTASRILATPSAVTSEVSTGSAHDAGTNERAARL